MSTHRTTLSARLRVAAAATLVLALAACGGETGASSAQEATSEAGTDLPLVYAAFATPLEEPWDGAIHAALESAQADGLIEYKYLDNLHTADEMETALRTIVADEEPDLIIGDAFAAEDAVRAVAADFPDIPFAFGSGGTEVAPNFSVFDNWLQDPAYLAGMLAGELTESGTIGVVGAMPIPEVNRIVNAFIAGAHETKPDATVTTSFINSFYDPATAKQAAEAAIAAGADVLFAERDGVIEAAAEASLPVFGMMVDQHDQAPDHVVTSLLWNMRPTIDALVEQITAGTYEAQNLAQYSFLTAGGSDIAPINTVGAFDLSEDVVAEVEARRQEILDGTFETPVDEDTPAGSTTVGE